MLQRKTRKNNEAKELILRHTKQHRIPITYD